MHQRREIGGKLTLPAMSAYSLDRLTHYLRVGRLHWLKACRIQTDVQGRRNLNIAIADEFFDLRIGYLMHEANGKDCRAGMARVHSELTETKIAQYMLETLKWEVKGSVVCG
jgi:hypothetical protein